VNLFPLPVVMKKRELPFGVFPVRQRKTN
jgi:hypothetical protein